MRLKQKQHRQWTLPHRAWIIPLMVKRGTENQQAFFMNQHTHLPLLCWWHVDGQICPPGGVIGPLQCSTVLVICSYTRAAQHHHIPCLDMYLHLRAHTCKWASQMPVCELWHELIWVQMKRDVTNRTRCCCTIQRKSELHTYVNVRYGVVIKLSRAHFSLNSFLCYKFCQQTKYKCTKVFEEFISI